MFVDEEKCEAYGLDSQKVASIARRISRAAREADDIGLTIFGGSGTGFLRYRQTERGGHQTTVAVLDGQYDGGDGGDNW